MPKSSPNYEFLDNYVVVDAKCYTAGKTFNQVYLEVNGTTKCKNLTIKHLIESSNGAIYRKSGAIFGVRLITVMEKELAKKIAILESQIDALTKKPVTTPFIETIAKPVDTNVKNKELTIEEQEAFEQMETERQQEELNLMELEDMRSMDEYINFKALEEMNFNESRPMSDEMYEYTAESLIIPNEEEQNLITQLEEVLVKKHASGLSSEDKSNIKEEYRQIKKSLKEYYEILDLRAQPILKMFCCDNYAKASAEMIVRQSLDLYIDDDGRVDNKMKSQFYEETYATIRDGIYKARLEKITAEVRQYVVEKYYS